MKAETGEPWRDFGPVGFKYTVGGAVLHLRLPSDFCIQLAQGYSCLHTWTYTHTQHKKQSHNPFYLQFISSEPTHGDFNFEETPYFCDLGHCCHLGFQWPSEIHVAKVHVGTHLQEVRPHGRDLGLSLFSLFLPSPVAPWWAVLLCHTILLGCVAFAKGVGLTSRGPETESMNPKEAFLFLSYCLSVCHGDRHWVSQVGLIWHDTWMLTYLTGLWLGGKEGIWMTCMEHVCHLSSVGEMQEH